MPSIIILDLKNVYSMMCVIAILLLTTSCISYFRINIEQRKKLRRLEEIINVLEERIL